MDWYQCKQMDPHLLVGLVNTELRNHSNSLDDLCRTHDINASQLSALLEANDYHYRKEINQFR